MTMAFRGFTADQERKLSKALQEVRTKLRTARLPPDLASGLTRRLNEVALEYLGKKGLCGKGTPPTASFTQGLFTVFICAKAFTATYQRKRRLPAILLHELVHTCEGNEVDAETFENLLFKGEGATPPDKKDLMKRFSEVDFKGIWVEMNRRTGDVTMRDTGRLLTNLLRTSPS